MYDELKRMLKEVTSECEVLSLPFLEEVWKAKKILEL